MEVQNSATFQGQLYKKKAPDSSFSIHLPECTFEVKQGPDTYQANFEGSRKGDPETVNLEYDLQMQRFKRGKGDGSIRWEDPKDGGIYAFKF